MVSIVLNKLYHQTQKSIFANLLKIYYKIYI